MNIEKERKAFDAWHLKQFKDINFDLSDEDSTALYHRVYSHEKQDLIRQMEFNAWLSSANREGYKLVPVEPTQEMIYAGESAEHKGCISVAVVYKAMIGACDEH